jgi:hypothetical protein
VARIHPRKDWAALKAAYRRGEGSIAQLAPKFGIAKSTAEKRCAKERWQVDRQEVGKEAEGKAREADVESLAAMLSKHRRLASRILELGAQRIEKAVQEEKVSANMLERMAGVLARAARQERLAAGIEPAKPVMAFETAGAGAVLRVKRRRNADVPEPAAAPTPPAKVA